MALPLVRPGVPQPLRLPPPGSPITPRQAIQLNAAGRLFDPRTKQPLYPLTPQITQALGRQRAPGLAFGPVREAIKASETVSQVVGEALDPINPFQLGGIGGPRIQPRPVQQPTLQALGQVRRPADLAKVANVGQQAFQQRPLIEQVVLGLGADPLNIVPGVGFSGPGRAVAQRIPQVARRATSLIPQRPPPVVPRTMADVPTGRPTVGARQVPPSQVVPQTPAPPGLVGRAVEPIRRALGGGEQGAIRPAQFLETLTDAPIGRGPTLPPTTTQQIGTDVLGIGPYEPGLTRTQGVLNAARRRTGIGIQDNPVVQPALKRRDDLIRSADSQATVVGDSLFVRLQQAFQPQRNGTIPFLRGIDESLQGAIPTIQDVAARLPRFVDNLSPAQVEAMRIAKEQSEPFRAQLDTASVQATGQKADIGSRSDIIEGGFYLPRGNALQEGFDAPVRISVGGGRGRPGFMQTADVPSQAEGIAGTEGRTPLEYSSLRDSLRGYFSAIGREIADLETANTLRPFGQPLAGRARDENIIKIGDLPSTTVFADEMANAANKVLRNQGILQGEGADIGRVARATKGVIVGLNTTLDNSAAGIQGLLGIANDPVATGAAFKVNAQSILNDGDQAFGKFVISHDERALRAGRMSAQDSARSGLVLRGENTEFQLDQNLVQSVFRRGGPIGRGVAEVVRRANRAFGFYGDTLRLREFDDLIYQQLQKGRTLDEIVSSGDNRRIAEVVNNTTGVADIRAFAGVKDFFLFAPRFFQSRLDTLAKGIGGLRPGAPLDQKIARRSLLRLVGYGTTLTFLVNEALGNDTDTRPFVNGRWNSNFMRIRLGNRDFTVFGTWDSLARLIATVGQGAATIGPNTAQEGLSGTFDSFAQIAGAGRGVINPLLGSAWELISNEDFFGRPTRDTDKQILKFFAETLSPISAQEIPSASVELYKGIVEGAAEPIAGAVATIVGEFFGGKSSPLSFTDVADEVGAELRIGRYTEAEPYQRDDIERSPRVAKKQSELPKNQFGTFNEIDAVFDGRLQALAEIKVGPKISIRQKVTQYFNLEAARSNQKQGAARALGLDNEREQEADPFKNALNRWFALSDQAVIQVPGQAEGVFSTRELSKLRFEFERDLKRQPGGLELLAYIRRNTNLRQVPRKLLAILPSDTQARIRLSERAREEHRQRIALPTAPAVTRTPSPTPAPDRRLLGPSPDQLRFENLMRSLEAAGGR